MRLVQRDAELAALTEFLTGCDTDEGRVVVVEGASGAGKSELLREFGRRATDSGALVLAAAASVSERALAFGVIGQLLRTADVPDAAGDAIRDAMALSLTANLGAELESVAGTPTAPAGRPSPQVIRDIVAELLGLASDRTLVVIVDDITAVDAPSLDVLLALQRRIGSARVLIVLSELRRRRLLLPGLYTEFSRAPGFGRMQVAGLDPDGVRELLGRSFDEDTAAAVAGACHAISGGNPLLVKALAEDHAAALAADSARAKTVSRFEVARDGKTEALSIEPREPEAAPRHRLEPGPAFARALISCIHRWGPDMVAVTRGLALLGEDASTTLIARLFELEAAVVGQLIDELDDTGLLLEGRFRHPAVRTVITEDVALSGTASLHVAAANLLLEDGGDAVDIARQLIAAGEVTGLTWAADVLRDAARSALDHGDVGFATDCLELALRAPEDEPGRALTVALLARVRWLTNPAAITRLIRPLRSALGAGHLGERDAIMLSNFLLWRGDATETPELDGSGVELVDPQSAAELDFAHGWRSFSHPTRFPDAGVDRNKPQRMPRLIDVMIHSANQEMLDRAEQVLQSCTITDTMLESVLSAVLTLIHGGQIPRALHWCSLLGAEARRLNARPWVAALADLRSQVAMEHGDLHAAERLSRQALNELPAADWGVAIGSPLSTLTRATSAMGKIAEAEKVIKQGVPDTMLATRFWAQYLRGRGYYYLASNRLHASLADFQACGDLLADWGLDLPEFLPWRSDAAQIQLALGRPERARELLTAQLSRPGGRNNRIEGTTTRILAGTHDLPKRAVLLGDAVAKLQESGAQLELALALADLGRTYQALGDSTRGRLVARRAKQIAKACHAEWLCEQTEAGDDQGLPDAAAPQGDDESGMGGLSDAERRVATLAASGYTNRDIARKLFVTVSTVEQHLTRVYRKLNVNRRADLPAELPLLTSNPS